MALFRSGIYDRLPPYCYVLTVAAARNGRAWSSLMVDVARLLEPPRPTPFARQDLHRYVRHLAAVHAGFLHDASLHDPALGLCTVRDFVLILAPATVHQEIARGRRHRVLVAAARGWTLFHDIAPRAAVQILTRVQQDVRPLLELLASAPHTLLHGDYKLANLGTLGRPSATSEALEARTIMLNWQDATVGPPLLDLGYFLAITAARLPISKAWAVALYRDALAAYGYTPARETWERDVALGLLAGGAMRLLWQHALATQAADRGVRSRVRRELAWWCAQVVHAGQWLLRW